MAGKRKSSKTTPGFIKFWILVCSAMLLLFVWGRVQIDFDIQELELMQIEKQSLLRDIDDLHVKINEMQQYKRIVELAKKQGLVFVGRSNHANLAVDFTGLEMFRSMTSGGIQIAGLGPVNGSIRQTGQSPFQESRGSD